MKKNVTAVFAAAAALSLTISGCSLSGDPEPTATPAIQAQVINVLGSYALIDGYTQYQSPDGGFSIQLPEGSVVNDADVNDVTVTVASAYTNADMINISKSVDVRAVETYDQLCETLGNDESIKVTGFYLLEFNGEYKGYKYAYTSADNEESKGIVSTYFHADGTVYIVKAMINNGTDERNVENVNTIVDTFVSYL